MFFQNTIIKRYLAMLNDEQVKNAWEQYKAHFQNPQVQERIRTSKEEQYQEGFLRDLFVQILGYTMYQSGGDYNLITEKKNETDSKKADGAILRDGKVIGIIELKDHKTPNLKQVETQAFGYKNQHRGTRYVIISNFEKLHFYIDDATEFREWDLFSLKEEDFRELYFCLSWGTLSQDLPINAKTESVSKEDQITQQLYKDYSAFKREMFADILKNNTTDETPKEQILVLFKKTQKLLDRLLFIFFAEDCYLLPSNMMLQIIKEWEQLKDMDVEIPLYKRIQQYFGYLDAGNEKRNIFAYNGGLFKPDEVLDGLIISDELLAQHTKKLSEYDYASEVDVNILGHIFENSLNEIEEVTAQINAGEAPTVSKRKRDGVFYTPQYITKYIVENTVGKLCAEKKAELGIDESEYFADKNRKMATKKHLVDNLTAYRNWLLEISICDPACGSGAFLNAALQFLMAEHKLIDEMEAKVTESPMPMPYIRNVILEKNLFGVDINEESVEIAKLALWLRTAEPNRKLSSLNNNIKCGNSLISDSEIAGDKAFNWQAEFPQVFAKGGFDIVIGNPPYVSTNMQMASLEMATQRQAIIDSHRYKTLIQKWDLYIPFIELGIRHLCKDKGRCSMIVPFPLTNQLYAQKARAMLLNEFSLYEVADLRGTKVFEDATVTSTIFFVQRKFEKQEINISKIEKNTLQPLYKKDKDSLLQDEKSQVWNLDNGTKITNRHEGMKVLGDYCYISKGMVLNSDEKKAKGEFIKEDLISLTKDVIHCRGYVEAKDIDKYIINRVRYLEYNTDRSPEKLSRPTFRELYNVPKLLTNKIGSLKVTIDINNLLCDQTNRICVLWKDLKGIENNSIIVSLKKYSTYSRTQLEQLSEKVNILYLLAILNSKYANCLLADIRGDGNIDVNPEYIRNIPIPECTDQQPFIDLADKMLSLNKDLQAKRARFLQLLQNNLPEVKITSALADFDTLDFAGFVAELKKQKIKLSLSQQDEWLDFFDKYKSACEELKSSIAATDAEINQLVYDLYGLTEEERKLIEQR